MAQRRRVVFISAGFAIVGAFGCQAILGIDETTLSTVASDDGGTDAPQNDSTAPDAASDADAASLTVLSVAPSLAHLVRGSSVDVEVDLTPAATTATSIAIDNLPIGVTASALSIAAGQTKGTLLLSATAAATLGNVPNVTLSAVNATSATLDLLVQDSSGSLDTTFNSSGIKSFVPSGQTATSSAVAVAAQSDGHLLVLVQPSSGTGCALTRLNVDGTIDATFTANMGTILPAGALMSDVAVGPSDKISIVGTGSGFAIIVRLNADGTPDTGFNFTGVSGANNPATFGNGNSASGVAIMSDGTAVVVGANYPAGSDNGLVLHFLNNGSLDGSFGPNGNGAYIPPLGQTELKRVVVDSADRIIAAGTNEDLAPVNLPFTLRLSKNGTVDSTFGDAGIVYVPTGSGAPMSANDIAHQPDAGYVVVGTDQGGVGGENFAGFVSEHGDASPTDSNDSPVGNVERFTAVAAQVDSKLLMVGYGGGTYAESTYLYRKLTYNAADPSFNDGGLVEFATGGMAGDPPKIFFHDVTTMPDGRIVVVGSQNGGGALVMRFWP